MTKNSQHDPRILIYVLSRLTSEIFDVSGNCESFWIKLSQASNSVSDSIFINASYHPPKSTSTEFLNYIMESSNKIRENYPNAVIFVGGDFNRVDLGLVEEDCGLFILDSPPTRDMARLDLILTNRPELINEVSTFKSQVESDHLGLIIKPKLKTKPKREMRFFRLYSSRGYQLLSRLLSEYDFKALYYINDIDEAAKWLDESIYWCFSNAFPTKQVRMSDQDPDWITPQVKWLINQKKQAKRRKNLKKMQKFEKKIMAQKMRRLLHVNKTGTRFWWRGIDTMTHRKQTGQKIVKDAFEPNSIELRTFSKKCNTRKY